VRCILVAAPLLTFLVDSVVSEDICEKKPVSETEVGRIRTTPASINSSREVHADQLPMFPLRSIHHGVHNKQPNVDPLGTSLLKPRCLTSGPVAGAASSSALPPSRPRGCCASEEQRDARCPPERRRRRGWRGGERGCWPAQEVRETREERTSSPQAVHGPREREQGDERTRVGTSSRCTRCRGDGTLRRERESPAPFLGILQN